MGKCVARLEAGLGVRLLHRSTRSVSLSDEGRLFYEHATRILSEVDNAAGAMARRKQTPRGHLRIDVPVSMGRLHVLPLVREYLDRWPDVEAELSFPTTIPTWCATASTWPSASAATATTGWCGACWRRTA